MDHMPPPNRVTGTRSVFSIAKAFKIVSLGVIAIEMLPP
jgi:hypothetical protein